MTATLPYGYGVMLQAAAHPSPEAAILARASELLIRDGWCQERGQFGTRRCTSRAIHQAACDLYPTLAGIAIETVFVVEEVLRDRGVFDRAEVWQDEPGRTENDVLDVLAAARALLSGCSAVVQR